jgi:hypothetical protein
VVVVEMQNTESSNKMPATIDEWLNSGTGGSKFVKLTTGRPTVLKFLTKGELVMRDFKNGKGSQPCTFFMVRTKEEPNQEKEFTTTSKQLVRQVRNYYDKGMRELEITRQEKGQSISYDIYPILPGGASTVGA